MHLFAGSSHPALASSLSKELGVPLGKLDSHEIQGFFPLPADALSSRMIFAEYFRTTKLRNPVVVAPDVGGAKRAKKFADTLGARLAILHKSRPEHHQAEVLEVVGDVK